MEKYCTSSVVREIQIKTIISITIYPPDVLNKQNNKNNRKAPVKCENN